MHDSYHPYPSSISWRDPIAHYLFEQFDQIATVVVVTNTVHKRQIMASTARTSTTFSLDDFVNEAGRNTSCLVGGDPTSIKPSTAQLSLKRSMESASCFSDSDTSVTSEEEEVEISSKQAHRISLENPSCG